MGSQWRLCPTKERYDRLPDYMRPTDYQIREPHPLAFDMFVWPQFRLNLINHSHKMSFGEIDEMIRNFAKALYVRWNESTILERTPSGKLKCVMLFITPLCRRMVGDLRRSLWRNTRTW
jgi:hypothetical protein